MKNWIIGFFSFPLVICLAIAAFIFYIIPFSDIEKLKTQYVAVRYDKKKAEVEYHLVAKRPATWVNRSAISPHAIHAIQISEDWGFYMHKGIDWFQLQQAFQEYWYEGSDLRGASTITQQLVKNLFLSADRSYWRKIREAMIALYLETRVPKSRILEVYLNIIEYGEGLYGIGGASRHYFAKSPLSITPREGAFLAMLLPNPVKYSVSYRKRTLTPFAQSTISSILGKMKMARHISEEQWAEEMNRRFSWEAGDESLLMAF